MQSVLSAVQNLRSSPLDVDIRNSNRYRLTSYEPDGSKTSYYFGVPIYNRDTRKLVSLAFRQGENGIFHSASNSEIELSDVLKMKNSCGTVTLGLPLTAKLVSENRAVFGNSEVFPTLNGVAVACDGGTITVETSKPLNVRANDRFFALMEEEFKPFAVISCIGAIAPDGSVSSPARLTYQKLSDTKYSLSFFGGRVLFEINTYESKLFSDTTVERENPSVNNVFGSVGFLGNSPFYGEQRLYSRVDASLLRDLSDFEIVKATWRFPMLKETDAKLFVSSVSMRFCSFGSDWKNKIAPDRLLAESYIEKGFFCFDISDLETLRNGVLVTSDKLAVVPTGDCSYAPQILEIRYKKGKRNDRDLS